MSESAPLRDAPASAERKRPTEPLRVAVTVADPDRAEQLRNVLGIHPAILLLDDPSQAEVVVTDVQMQPLLSHPPTAKDMPPPAPGTEALPTPREREVLELLALGASNKMIARRLGISLATTKFHVAALFAKLGARNRSDAVAIAVRRGLLLL